MPPSSPPLPPSSPPPAFLPLPLFPLFPVAAAVLALAEATTRATNASFTARSRRCRGRGFLVASATTPRRLHVVYDSSAPSKRLGAHPPYTPLPPVFLPPPSAGARAAAEGRRWAAEDAGFCAVFEAGSACTGSVWGKVVDLLKVRDGARMLRYDRAGFGGSDVDLRAGRGVSEAASDMVAAVRNSGARGPYVLVAHSLGAIFVDAALRTHGLKRSEILGVVYVDGASMAGVRGLERMVPKASPPRWLATALGRLGVLRVAMPRVMKSYADAFGEGRVIRAEAVEMWARGDWLVSYTREWASALRFAVTGGEMEKVAGEEAPEDDTHARVASAMRRPWGRPWGSVNDEYGPGWLGDLPISVVVPDVYERTEGMEHVGSIQKQLAEYSSDVELFEPQNCGHFVQLERPETVVEAIYSVVRRARVKEKRDSADYLEELSRYHHLADGEVKV